MVRDIKDPEHPYTLEQLNVIQQDQISVSSSQLPFDDKRIKIEFTPTVPHCSLATLIGLCIRVKLQRSLQTTAKIDIFVSEGTHSTAPEINKQINDKERVDAAMQNPNLRMIVEECIKDPEY